MSQQNNQPPALNSLDYARTAPRRFSWGYFAIWITMTDVFLIFFVGRNISLDRQYGVYHGLYGYGREAVKVCVGMTIVSFAFFLVALATAKTVRRLWLLLLLPVFFWEALCCAGMMGIEFW